MLKRHTLLVLIISLALSLFSCKEEIPYEYKTMIDKEIIDLRISKKASPRKSKILLHSLDCSTDSVNYHTLNLGLYLAKINNEITYMTDIKEEMGFLTTKHTRSSYLLKNDTLFYMRNMFLSQKDNSELCYFKNRVFEPIASYRKSDSIYFHFKPFKNSKIHVSKGQEIKVQGTYGRQGTIASTKTHVKLGDVSFKGFGNNSPDANVSDILYDFSPERIEIDNYNGLKYKYFESYYLLSKYNSKDEHMIFFNDKNIILENR